jgi:sulfur-oxidizing protein SoxY
MTTRREILIAAACAGLGLPLSAVFAGPKEARQRLAELTGGVKASQKGVTITLPDVTGQGRYVPMRISVDSPMTEDDYVKAIHVVAERNPTPAIASFHLTPASGKAVVSTRIRLLETQVVVAAAEMSDGRVLIGKGRSKITGGAGGCG